MRTLVLLLLVMQWQYDAMAYNLKSEAAHHISAKKCYITKRKVVLKSLKHHKDAFYFDFGAVLGLALGHISSARYLEASNLNPTIKDTFL